MNGQRREPATVNCELPTVNCLVPSVSPKLTEAPKRIVAGSDGKPYDAA